MLASYTPRSSAEIRALNRSIKLKKSAERVLVYMGHEELAGALEAACRLALISKDVWVNGRCMRLFIRGKLN